MVDADRFREAMRRMASGVSVITTDGPAGRFGVTVSSMCSLSLEPPSVLACVHYLSPALRAIVDNGVFCANVLCAEQTRVSESFAGRLLELKDDKFACAEWDRLATGSPVLRDALIAFDCRLSREVEFGSHRILMGTVVELAARDGKPLIYADRSYRSIAA
ncbi:MAG TPA: flavin reductase family protein [Alphaproteobacteria bacterium]|nr:flavin reductase family protein [Alphaproteobacteria bacterium]